MSDSIKNLYEFQLTSKILQASGVGSTFTISNDILTSSTVSLTNWAILLENRNGSVRELMKIDASSGIATIDARGIKPDWTTDTTLQYERPKGTSCKVVVLEDQIFDKASDDTMTGDVIYEGNFTAGTTDTTKYGISVKSLTTTEKNALSSPPDGTLILDETLWTAQMKIGGTFTWLGAGATTPNASTTASGKVEISTDAEILAETDTWGTGAQLVATPSQLSPAKLTDKTSAHANDKIRIADSEDSDSAKYITVDDIRDAIPASDTARWTVEKATTAELEAWTADKFPDSSVALSVLWNEAWYVSWTKLSGTWTENVAHGLTKAPIAIWAYCYYDNDTSECSNGMWIDSNERGNTYIWSANISEARLIPETASWTSFYATVSSVDVTNIVLNWAWSTKRVNWHLFYIA